MSINWFSRVFGRNRPNADSAPIPADVGLTEMTVPETFPADSDELAAELARARRYEHDLSIAVLSASPVRGASSAGGAVGLSAKSKLPQMVALLSAVALREALRHSDVVCYHAAENRFVLALTESDAEDASHALERVRAHFQSHLRLTVRSGVAHFPSDAFTLDELVTTAASRAVRTTAPTKVAGNGRRHAGSRRRADGPGIDHAPRGRRA